MSFPADNFTFAGAAYRLIVPAMNQRAPTPRARLRRQWVEHPFGPNRNVGPSNKYGPTIWSPQGGIVIVSQSAYTTFQSRYGQVGNLVTPFGTFTAILTQLDVVPHTDGSYRGSVTWEWA